MTYQYPLQGLTSLSLQPESPTVTKKTKKKKKKKKNGRRKQSEQKERLRRAIKDEPTPQCARNRYRTIILNHADGTKVPDQGGAQGVKGEEQVPDQGGAGGASWRTTDAHDSRCVKRHSARHNIWNSRTGFLISTFVSVVLQGPSAETPTKARPLEARCYSFTRHTRTRAMADSW